MSVAWIKNDSDQYEVFSAQHLLQIMNRGELYTDTGDPPVDYWGNNYVQTVDIDLASDHASIVCIGNGTTSFQGGYDGNLFKISNWTYVQEVEHAGLFGYVANGAIRRVRLAGAWGVSNCSEYVGFLAGYLKDSTVYDTEGDFSTGTTIDNGPVSGGIMGTLVGTVDGGTLYGAVVKGTVDIEHSYTGYHGGIIGSLAGSTDIAMCKNVATFPSGITGGRVGGIVGISKVDGSLRVCKNAMIGYVSGTTGTGGICGAIEADQDITIQSHSLVNSMTRNLNGNGGYVGGIFGYLYPKSNPMVLTGLINYMSGDIVANADTSAAGIVGYLNKSGSGDTSITNSIVAMNGTVHNAVRGDEAFTPSLVEVSVDTAFGMAYTSDDYASDTPLEGYTTNPTFTELPYVLLTGTDPDGKGYASEVVFANLAGNLSYSDYTHLTIHTNNPEAPFYADLGLSETNTDAYLTYANLAKKALYVDGSLSVAGTTATVVYDHSASTVLYGTAPVITCDPRPLNVFVYTSAFLDRDGVTFRLTHQQSGLLTEIFAHDGFTETDKSIEGLDPETTYTIRLYADSGSGDGYTLLGQEECTTDSNSAENYAMEDFIGEDGEYDISNVGDSISPVMNDLFTTGASVVVGMDFAGRKSMTTTFVKRGESIDVATTEAILLPFHSTAGDSQAATIQLSDNEAVAIGFNNASGDVTIGGTEYASGQSLIIDGKKVTVVDI